MPSLGRVQGWPPDSVANAVTHRRATWASGSFSAACENVVEYTDENRHPVPVVERRVETRTREYPRGQHRVRDPWWDVHARGRCSWEHVPRNLRGEADHLQQRHAREQARRTRDAERVAGVRSMLEGALHTQRAAEASMRHDFSAAVAHAAQAALHYAVGAVHLGTMPDGTPALRRITEYRGASWPDHGIVDLAQTIGLQPGETLHAHAEPWDARTFRVTRGDTVVCEVAITDREMHSAIAGPVAHVASRLRHALADARRLASDTT